MCKAERQLFFVGLLERETNYTHMPPVQSLKTTRARKQCERRMVLRTLSRSALALATGVILGPPWQLRVDAATCCVNTTSGLAFDSCVCLVDNSQVTGQNVTRGESGLYHWVLESSSSELITLVPRGNVTFRVSVEARLRIMRGTRILLRWLLRTHVQASHPHFEYSTSYTRCIFVVQL